MKAHTVLPVEAKDQKGDIYFLWWPGCYSEIIVLEGKTVNSVHIQGPKMLLRQILRVRPQFWEKDNWFLLH